MHIYAENTAYMQLYEISIAFVRKILHLLSFGAKEAAEAYTA